MGSGHRVGTFSALGTVKTSEGEEEAAAAAGWAAGVLLFDFLPISFASGARRAIPDDDSDFRSQRILQSRLSIPETPLCQGLQRLQFPTTLAGLSE